MRRGRRSALALVLALSGTLALLRAPEAPAVEVQAAGWWSRIVTTDPLRESPQPLPVPNPTTPQPVLTDPTAAPGQLLVQGAPEGATAIAAVRWKLADGESSPSLTLAALPGSVLPADAVILACAAASPWEPVASSGSWQAKAVPDAVRCIDGIVAADGASVAFGLQPLVRRGVLDVVFVPGRRADLPPEASSSTFRLVFATPTPESLAVVAGSDFEEGAGSVVVTVPAPEPSAGAPVGVTLPPLTPTVPSVAVAAPALEPEEVAIGAPTPVQALPEAFGSDGSRTIGVVLLGLAGLTALWAWLDRPTEAVTAMGVGRFRREVANVARSPQDGGLGRFTRSRTEPPPSLR